MNGTIKIRGVAVNNTTFECAIKLTLTVFL